MLNYNVLCICKKICVQIGSKVQLLQYAKVNISAKVFVRHYSYGSILFLAITPEPFKLETWNFLHKGLLAILILIISDNSVVPKQYSKIFTYFVSTVFQRPYGPVGCSMIGPGMTGSSSTSSTTLLAFIFSLSTAARSSSSCCLSSCSLSLSCRFLNLSTSCNKNS